MGGVRQHAALANVAPEAFADRILESVVTRMGEEILKKIIIDEAGAIPESKTFDYLLAAAVGEASMRTAKVKDVDMRNCTLIIHHPKGEVRFAR